MAMFIDEISPMVWAPCAGYHEDSKRATYEVVDLKSPHNNGDGKSILYLCYYCADELTNAISNYWIDWALYSAFCMSWVSVAYAAIIGKE